MSLSNSTDRTISKVDACNAVAHLLTTGYGHDVATVAAWREQIAGLVSNTIEDLADGVTATSYAWALADTIDDAYQEAITDEEMVNRVHEKAGVSVAGGGRD